MRDELERTPSDQSGEDQDLNDSGDPIQADSESHETVDETEESNYRKPLLARLINGAGMETSIGVDIVLDWVQVLVIAGILAWFTMSFAMVRMRVPTESMEPTILVNDSFFVDKFTYGVGINEPEPGDIIVFWHTHQFQRCKANSFLFFSWGEEVPCKERFVKRLIAKGPAQVAIRQGEVYVNDLRLDGEAFNRDYVCNRGEATRPPQERPTEGCEYDVPEGKWFVLGDNTPNSNDSRFWGSLDKSEFIGEPFLRVWPINRIGPMNGYFGTQH